MSTGLSRFAAAVQAGLLRAATAVVDASPDVIRFGYGHAARRIVLQRPLRRLQSEGTAAADTGTTTAAAGLPVVALVTRTLGTGGVEAIVAMLATGLPDEGLLPVVVCERGGETADLLRSRGVRVLEAADETTAAAVLADLGPIGVAELHNAPDHLIAACLGLGIPIVPVIHTTDINLRATDWARSSDLLDRSAAAVAVSATVRAFTEARLPRLPEVPITVVTNGVPPRASGDLVVARERLGRLVGADLAGATVFVCLARYDMQKNVPGLVSAFVGALDAHGGDAHLVVAGPVEDWLEHAHADAVRRSSVHGARVHLLGASSSPDLLAAADAFVLDSFFEGWPVAVSEAVMAGLPVVVSEVGGAIELVGAGERGLICENPASAPATITLADIRRARRRRTQRNRDQFVAALRSVMEEADQWRSRRAALAAEAAGWLSAAAMVRAHGRLLARVEDASRGAS